MRVSTDKVRIPGYTIVDMLGEGGLGKVYRAYKSNLSLQSGGQEIRKYFAIKVIDVEKAKEHSNVDTLIHEIEISSQINYPNIVQVIDFGEVGSSIYIVMEMLEGFSLGEILHYYKQPIPEDVALTIIHEIAKTLRYVHFEHLKASKEAIVHADISLQNIFIEKHTYRTKLMDFGCAKKIARGTRYSIADDELTFANVFFAAPEQARQQWLDPRSDIYSLGVVFFDLITNARERNQPLKAAHIKACDGLTIKRSLLEERNLGNAAIVTKMVEMDPAKRYQSADHLIEAIERRLAALSFSYVNGQKDLKRIFATVEAAHRESVPAGKSPGPIEPGVTKPLQRKGANQTKILPKKAKSSVPAKSAPEDEGTKDVGAMALSAAIADKPKLTVVPLLPTSITRYALPALGILLLCLGLYWLLGSDQSTTSRGGSKVAQTATKGRGDASKTASASHTPSDSIAQTAPSGASPSSQPDQPPATNENGESAVPEIPDLDSLKENTPNPPLAEDKKLKEKPENAKPTEDAPGESLGAVGGDSPEEDADTSAEAPPLDPAQLPGTGGLKSPLTENDTAGSDTPPTYTTSKLTIVSRSAVWRNLKILNLGKKGRKKVIFNKPLVNRLVVTLKPGRYRLIAKHPKYGKAKSKTVTITNTQATRRVTL